MSVVAVDETTDARPRATLQSVQVMRGVAALAVVLYHTHLLMARADMGSVDVFGAWAGFGWTGVSFFFVLSGFIISLAHGRDIDVPGRARTYLWRRFVRVYPIYWVFLTVYIAAAWWGLGSPDFAWTPRNLLASYLLVQLGEPPRLPLQVAWTLFYEVSFYLAFLLLILNRRAGTILIALWAAAIVVDVGVLGNVENGWYLHSWNFYFAAGALACWLFARLDDRWGMPLFGAGLALLLAIFASGMVDRHVSTFQNRPGPLLLLAIPFTITLLGGALWDRRLRWRAPAALMLLGDASYAIYLTHSAAISVLVPQLHKHGGAIAPSAQFWLIAALATVGGTAAHLFVERPLLARLRDATSPRGAARLRPVAR